MGTVNSAPDVGGGGTYSSLGGAGRGSRGKLERGSGQQGHFREKRWLSIWEKELAWEVRQRTCGGGEGRSEKGPQHVAHSILFSP